MFSFSVEVLLPYPFCNLTNSKFDSTLLREEKKRKGRFSVQVFLPYPSCNSPLEKSIYSVYTLSPTCTVMGSYSE